MATLSGPGAGTHGQWGLVLDGMTRPETRGDALDVHIVELLTDLHCGALQ